MRRAENPRKGEPGNGAHPEIDHALAIRPDDVCLVPESAKS